MITCSSSQLAQTLRDGKEPKGAAFEARIRLECGLHNIFCARYQSGHDLAWHLGTGMAASIIRLVTSHCIFQVVKHEEYGGLVCPTCSLALSRIQCPRESGSRYSTSHDKPGRKELV